jgi:protein-tyrosine-phosphatase
VLNKIFVCRGAVFAPLLNSDKRAGFIPALFVVVLELPHMHIHIVCSGNSYRSRLVEAYIKSKMTNPNIQVSSSGIAAKEHHFTNGPICWYAMRLLKRHHLIDYMSWRERQTTSSMLHQTDRLITMNQLHADYCLKLGFKGEYEVWSIPDLNEMKGFIPSSEKPSIEMDINHIELTEKTFSLIQNKADQFLRKNNLL